MLCQASAADLIALDSPFISDPPVKDPTASTTEANFESVWNRLQHANLRGWCDSPIDVVVRRLQGLQRKMRVISVDEPPFKGKYLQSANICVVH
jgi:AP-4 complex subunit epsilon-1